MKKIVKIILINKKEILLYKRDNKPSISYPGYWDLIGGAVEKNESEKQALKREIKEEINCEIKNIKFVKKIQLFSYGEDYSLFFFRGDIDTPIEKITLTEGQYLKYFTFEELPKIKIPEHQREIILNNKNKIL